MLTRKSIILLLAFNATSLFAQPRDSDIQVSIKCVPDGLPLRVGVRVSDAKPLGQYLQVAITNTSDREIALTQLTARIPYPRPTAANALIATGAWDMGRTQTRVWPATTTEKLESGTFVLTNGGTTSMSSVLAGFVTWKIFHSKLLWEADTLVITAEGEGRTLKPNETVSMEKVWLARGGTSANWQDLLFTYADLIAAENHIHLNPIKPWIGWGTWDYYGFGWNHDIVKATMNTLLEIAPQANLLQIDAGWGGPKGGFMEATPRLGNDGLGMKRIADLLHSKNLSAGTYFVPMRDSPKSGTAREHPEFFLKDANAKILLSAADTNKKDRVNVFYDYSNPATCDFIKRAIANSRAWGFTYYKTDFLRDGIIDSIRRSIAPAAQIVPYDRSLTSVERFHRGMAAMREGMGPDSYFLSCSAVFGPSFGHADALRAGSDIAPKFNSYKKAATDNSGSFYLHEKVIHIDTDYVVVRAAQDQDATRTDSKGKDGGNLKLNEAQMWAHFVALCSSTRLSSDDLLILRPERRALFAFAATFPASERFIPLDFWQHARAKDDPPSLILSKAKGDCYLGVFNWTDKTGNLTLTGIPAVQLAALATLSGDVTVAKNDGTLTLTLKSRHSAILKFPSGDFDTLRHEITVK